MQTIYDIGLDVHKRTISYCVKDGGGTIHAEGTIPATRFDLDRWMKTLPQPWTAILLAVRGLVDKNGDGCESLTNFSTQSSFCNASTAAATAS